MERLSQLCIADQSTFWPWRAWPEFARWPDKAAVTVILPVAGFADWDLGAPLDVEETVLLSVLALAASREALPKDRFLILPPQRFILGPDSRCAFAVDPTIAHAALEEWCASVAAAGFRRVVFYNSSPWNEELCDAAARDLRIERGLQMFCVHLSALGLDFAPWRDRDRQALRAVLADLATTPPRLEPGSSLSSAVARLAGLLREISARAPLANNGQLFPLAP